jgi:3-vinyl bacteriochlorophyllide hydratase
MSRARTVRAPLYTPEQRVRRDRTRWTVVQGILAPVQFLVCLISAALVLRFLATGQGLAAANFSVVIKTILLYTIMVTGSIWEKVVFDQWLFAAAFFWEDVVSMGVIALHTFYIVGLSTGSLSSRTLMFVALAAYATYIVNATQFILKLRAARLMERDMSVAAAVVAPRRPATPPAEVMA